jgi:hypothetical protein
LTAVTTDNPDLRPFDQGWRHHLGLKGAHDVPGSGEPRTAAHDVGGHRGAAAVTQIGVSGTDDIPASPELASREHSEADEVYAHPHYVPKWAPKPHTGCGQLHTRRRSGSRAAVVPGPAAAVRHELTAVFTVGMLVVVFIVSRSFERAKAKS